MSDFPRPGYRRLKRYAPDRRPARVDLCDNTNLWGAHPAALEAVRAAPDERLIRYPSVYADVLRDAIAAKFGVPTETVATGCGSDDLLDSTFRAVAEPGGRIVQLAPTFSMIEPFATMNGLDVVTLPGWPKPPEPERLLEAEPALVYLCSPNNPTGERLDPEWIGRLLEAGGAEGPVVLVDEAYIDFAGEEEGFGEDVDQGAVGGERGEGERATRTEPAPGMLPSAPGSARLLVLRTFSKAYGLAGLRVGYAVGPPEVVGEIEKSRGPYKVGHLAERAAVAGLEDREGWVGEVVREVRENRRRLAGALGRRGFRPLTSEANFLLLPLAARLPGLGAVPASKRLRERGVAVRPFPALDGIGEALRVTIGPWPLMEEFLAALDALVTDDQESAPSSGKSRNSGRAT